MITYKMIVNENETIITEKQELIEKILAINIEPDNLEIVELNDWSKALDKEFTRACFSAEGFYGNDDENEEDDEDEDINNPKGWLMKNKVDSKEYKTWKMLQKSLVKWYAI